MAQEILVRFVVDDTQLEQTQKEIESLGGSIEKVKKTTKKAGSDISDSFNDAGQSADNLNGGVLGIVREIKNLAKAAKIGGAAMRSALIATGIGALVVALGTVVAYWDDISRFVGLTDTKLQDLIDTQNRYIDNLDFQLSLLKEQEKTLKLLGKSTIENREEQEKQIKLLQTANIERLEALKLQLQTETSQAKELSFFQKLLNLRALAPATQGSISEEEQTRLDEINKQIQDAELRAERLKQALIEVNTTETPKNQSTRTPEQRADVTSVDSGLEQGIADPYNEQKQKDALRLQALQEGTEEFAIAEQQRIDNEVLGLIKSAEIQNRKTEDEKENAEARIRISEEEFQAKQMLLDGISGSLDAASELAGRNTAVGKTLAVASALIDTYAAIAGQLKAFSGVPIPGYAIAQSIATGLAGFAAVKNILAVKVPGGGGGGASANFSSSSTPQAPSFNVVGTSGVNQLAQTLGNDETPIRAYVVGGDVTSQQEFDRNVIETSSI